MPFKFEKFHAGQNRPLHLSRRQFVTGLSCSALLGTAPPALAALAGHAAPALTETQTLRGNNFALNIDLRQANFTGRVRSATAINGSVPAPVLRWQEGERVTLQVTNNLLYTSSIHWHGMILPTRMDGVPGLSFDGIAPGATFTYQFDVKQSGTYWYHSHSGFQEQTGLYGAIVIDPAGEDPVAYDRDYVVMLSDWSDEQPEDIYAKLKKMSHYYNFRERTVGDILKDIKHKGIAETWKARTMWNQMRMSDTDIADVTGYTYTFLCNGRTPEQGWTGVFKPGEKIRLRIINAAAMTIFDFRIPGLKMKVVASDGQNIEPISVDEFRIGVAETYDVIVEPDASSAYTLFAQSIDRTGYARGTLTPGPGLKADIPAMDHAPVLGHRDMGMSMQGMDHSAHQGGGDAAHENHGAMNHDVMDHSSMNHGAMNHGAMNHGAMNHAGHAMPVTSERNAGLSPAGYVSEKPITHFASEFGPHVDMRVEQAPSGLTDPGLGLRDHATRYGRRVLRYADLVSLHPTRDRREPQREIELHLTGNMNRYMWSMNGIKFADADPIILKHGERVRFTLINDTMMTHPMHLHGLWSELETGEPDKIPRKHTVLVQPGSRISYLVTADSLGRWAYHCHLMYHMPGMFREVRVV
ncbi:MAG: copper resistance system multicopper oxidase [Gammaproteobacteria bacterium]|nr:copper resistance system multicopper oxidase [Gammaproteobacteria bacterium]MBT8150076.1 copper resistance system multicopper oxidase [Gammaproteobacteria bacterium]NND38195.1 copper resistance system multicopper oxidase [Pseudomonadales bacterium]NNL11696.1 copper resistance system multicopper oxidase [Pseudomonadales bacterium]NNM12433.1 copper resistance system multicopper oxidase [Pseudomonadales bacterium]